MKDIATGILEAIFDETKKMISEAFDSATKIIQDKKHIIEKI
jgi:hypothetical protein